MILGYRKEAGYQTLAFISRAFVPEEERADIQLFAYRGEAKEYHSMTAPAALVDALVVAVSEQMGEARRKPLPSVPYEKNLCAKPVKFQRASGGQSLPVILQLLSEIAAIVNPTAAILFCTDWRLFHMLVKRSVIRCRFS